MPSWGWEKCRDLWESLIQSESFNVPSEVRDFFKIDDDDGCSVGNRGEQGFVATCCNFMDFWIRDP